MTDNSSASVELSLIATICFTIGYVTGAHTTRKRKRKSNKSKRNYRIKESKVQSGYSSKTKRETRPISPFRISNKLLTPGSEEKKKSKTETFFEEQEPDNARIFDCQDANTSHISILPTSGNLVEPFVMDSPVCEKRKPLEIEGLNSPKRKVYFFSPDETLLSEINMDPKDHPLVHNLNFNNDKEKEIDAENLIPVNAQNESSFWSDLEVPDEFPHHVLFGNGNESVSCDDTFSNKVTNPKKCLDFHAQSAMKEVSIMKKEFQLDATKNEIILDSSPSVNYKAHEDYGDDFDLTSNNICADALNTKLKVNKVQDNQNASTLTLKSFAMTSPRSTENAEDSKVIVDDVEDCLEISDDSSGLILDGEVEFNLKFQKKNEVEKIDEECNGFEADLELPPEGIVRQNKPIYGFKYPKPNGNLPHSLERIRTLSVHAVVGDFEIKSDKLELKELKEEFDGNELDEIEDLKVDLKAEKIFECQLKPETVLGQNTAINKEEAHDFRRQRVSSFVHPIEKEKFKRGKRTTSMKKVIPLNKSENINFKGDCEMVYDKTNMNWVGNENDKNVFNQLNNGHHVGQIQRLGQKNPEKIDDMIFDPTTGKWCGNEDEVDDWDFAESVDKTILHIEELKMKPEEIYPTNQDMVYLRESEVSWNKSLRINNSTIDNEASYIYNEERLRVDILRKVWSSTYCSLKHYTMEN
ncbi:hypothetical protein ROZALSC1DRAFT_22754 [Rozella allomycis CSF55]|uniref:Uncharacterized protein n=1 Tax=Rozella allomycis (strain CSF55) TaxID=988480 RepID=A0A4P9YHS8_ROZAC|nr:hypothetical protein ROZALSC1DRAFT_22754 [Rozella allomycis CSF55]